MKLPLGDAYKAYMRQTWYSPKVSYIYVNVSKSKNIQTSKLFSSPRPRIRDIQPVCKASQNFVTKPEREATHRMTFTRREL